MDQKAQENSRRTLSKTTRQALLLERVSQTGAFAVGTLAEEFAVSEETIRRDIKEMERKGLVRRKHGGATLPDGIADTSFQERLRHNAEGKRAIGRAVAALLADGDSILIETGTTATFVAQALREHKGLIVITNSVDVARSLAFRADNEVYMAGGKLTADDGASLGQTAVDYISKFRVKYAILSAAAIDAKDGLMAQKVAEAEFSRAVISRAENVILVADQSKFGRRSLVSIGDLSLADIVATDARPDAEFETIFTRNKTRLIVAS